MTDMLALRYHGRRDIRLETLPRPTPAPGEVLLRVTDAGLSQTQINEFMEGPFIINAAPHPRTGVASPLIPCQEYGGTVEAVGPGVDASLLGRQLAVLPLDACGQCDRCRAGQANLCSTLAYRGLVGLHGGFCGWSAVPASATLAVPDGRRDLLTFIEPLLVGVHSMRRQHGPLAGARVLVVGAGAVGCALAAVWQQLADARVSVYDRLPARLARSAETGLATCDDPAAQPAFDIVVDAAGKDTLAERQALEQAYDWVRPGGVVVTVGTYFSPLSMVPVGQLVTEKTTLPSFAYDHADVAVLAEALPRLTVRFDALIQRLRLDQMVEHGYYEAELDKSRFTRIVCSVDG